MTLARIDKLALGFAAGGAIAVAASWLRMALAGSLRIETASLDFVLSSLVLGGGLALASFCAWRIVRDAPSFPRTSMLRAALLGQVVLGLALPITSTDFFQYLAYGELQLAGHNPLAAGPTALGTAPILDLVSPTWANQPSVYGPLLLLVFRGAAQVGAWFASPVWIHGIALKLVMMASAMGTLLCAAGFLRVHRPASDGDRALAIIAFSPLLAWEISGQGHTDGFLTLALMLFVWSASAERALFAVLALTAGICVKVTLAPVLALYLLLLLRRRGMVAVAYGLLTLGGMGLLMLPYREGFPGLGPLVSAVRATHSHSFGDLAALMLAPLGRPAQEMALNISFVVNLVVCALVFGVTALRARTVPQVLRGTLLFYLAWDMTVPLFQPWYATWLLPLVIADQDPRWHRLVAIYTILCVLQWTAQIDAVTTVVLNLWVIWRAARLLSPDDRPTAGRPEAAGQAPR